MNIFYCFFYSYCEKLLTVEHGFIDTVERLFRQGRILHLHVDNKIFTTFDKNGTASFFISVENQNIFNSCIIYALMRNPHKNVTKTVFCMCVNLKKLTFYELRYFSKLDDFISFTVLKTDVRSRIDTL